MIVQGLAAIDRSRREPGESDARLNVAADLLAAMLVENIELLEAVVFDPWVCPNCDRIPPEAKKIFCGQLCGQEASLVRYVRRKLTAGQLADLDVLRDGIGTDLLMVRSGGYPERARRVSDAMRRLVNERDGGRCRRCGKPGTDIDHIDGDVAALENLQLLCALCNGTKMIENVTTIDAEEHPELFAFIRAQRRRLALRVVAALPLRVCDDETTWPMQWQAIKKQCIASRKRTKPREMPQTCESSSCIDVVTGRSCYTCGRFVCDRHVTRVRTGPPGHGETDDYCADHAAEAYKEGADESALRIDAEGDWYSTEPIDGL